MYSIYKLVFVFLILGFAGCASKKTFSPVIKGKCLDSNALIFWKNSNPGDTKKPSNPLLALGDIAVQVGTVIPMYFLDVGHLATSTTGMLLGSMPQCGNWCGSGFPLPTENPPVIDPLDAACRKHDLCYRVKGKFDCSCDQQLAYDVLRGRSLLELSALEIKIVAFFRASHCENGCKQIAGTKNCSNRYEKK